MELGQENILITGAAGFIGAALSENLLKKGVNVFGVDSLNSYYEISLKKANHLNFLLCKRAVINFVAFVWSLILVGLKFLDH